MFNVYSCNPAYDILDSEQGNVLNCTYNFNNFSSEKVNIVGSIRDVKIENYKTVSKASGKIKN